MENHMGEKEKNPAQKEKDNLKPSFKKSNQGSFLLGQSQDWASLAYTER